MQGGEVTIVSLRHFRHGRVAVIMWRVTKEPRKQLGSMLGDDLFARATQFVEMYVFISEISCDDIDFQILLVVARIS